MQIPNLLNDNLRTLLALALLIVWTGAQSQNPPAPAKAGQPQQNQTNRPDQQAAKDQRGTEKSPFVVKTLTGPKTKEATDQEAKERDQKSPNDWWIAGSTVWLAAVTTALAFFTAFLWNATRKLVRGAEDTAKRQLRAYVGVVYQEIRFDPGGKGLAVVEYANKGVTPAHDVDLRVSAKAFEFDGTPKWEEPNTVGDEGKGGVVLPSVLWTRHCDIDTFDAEPLKALAERKKRVWVWGTIRYVDIFDEPCYVQFRFWSSTVRKERLVEGQNLVYFSLIPDIENTKATYGKKA